ncbi:hypothetical protein RSP799_16080 [Ralstonia solanacearum]|nr:hypothetical protein RSP799_16080 [Ralstonia solanacearum]
MVLPHPAIQGRRQRVDLSFNLMKDDRQVQSCNAGVGHDIPQLGKFLLNRVNIFRKTLIKLFGF